jgi:hypothetical protein
MITCRPATLADIPAVIGLLDPYQLSMVVGQVMFSPAATLLADDRPVAMVGLYQHADSRELWFATRGRLVPRQGLQIIRLLRGLLPLVPDDLPIFARVLPEHATGLRLANAFGQWREEAVAGQRILYLCRNRATAAPMVCETTSKVDDP